MVLTTTTSADGKLSTFQGTAQEVLDALEDVQFSRRLGFGRDGADSFWALVHAV